MVIFKGDPGLKEVALLFDDGPNPKITPRLLELLAAKNVPANFFLIGMKAEQAPEVAAQIANSGHEIGNHTYTHKRLSLVLETNGKQAVIDEIKKGEDSILSASGIKRDKLKYLRLPYNDWSSELMSILQPLYGDNIVMSGLAIADWNWGQDATWDSDDSDAIKDQARQIVKTWRQVVTNGTLLGFHDSSQHNLTGNSESKTWMNRALPTLEAMPAIIDHLLETGYQIKRLSEMKLVTEALTKDSQTGQACSSHI